MIHYTSVRKRIKVMGKLTLENGHLNNCTTVSNYFLDYYMPNANGEFVKIYLYLIRSVSIKELDLSISRIADIFNHTEKDVVRALKYWEQEKLITLSYDENHEINCIRLESNCPSHAVDHTVYKHSDTHDESCVTIASDDSDSTVYVAPEPVKAINADAHIIDEKEKPVYTAKEIAALKENEDIKDILYIAQTYIGKTFSAADTNIILYFYDTLSFPIELIEYLIEYCVSNNHKTLRYIEKVALDWHKEGIDTVEKAKSYTSMFSKNCFPIFKAFGLTGRNPAKVEKDYIVKWTDEYGFSIDIIIDACNRTIQAIHQPSFEYADSILSKWKKRGITKLGDIKVLDEEHAKNKEKHNAASTQTAQTRTPAKTNFNSFPQRTYDYEELERKLLKIR